MLTTGLSSELFLLAYLEPNNIRQLAQKLQNTSGDPTNYSKAHPAIQDLAIENYLKFNSKDEKHYVNLQKLTDELESILIERDILLNEDEKNYLQKILEQNEFFKIISQDIVKKIQAQEKGIHRINAIDVFCERIGVLSAGALLHRKTQKNDELESICDPKLSFDENIKEIQKILQEIGSGIDEGIKNIDNPMIDHPIFREFLLPVVKHMDSLMVFYMIPLVSLEKLMLLWGGSDGVKLALQAIDNQ